MGCFCLAPTSLPSRRPSESDAELCAGLRAVEYSSRYALGLFFDTPGALDVPWGAKYVSDHPVIRYVAVDNVKRGKGKKKVYNADEGWWKDVELLNFHVGFVFVFGSK